MKIGAIQVLHNAVGAGEGGGVRFPRIFFYGGVQFNGISVMRGWIVVKFPEKSIT